MTRRFSRTAVTITYNPRVARGKATACIGDTETDSGTATLTAAGLGSATVNYTSQSFVEAEETVFVPAGTFQALRMRWVSRLFGTVDGEPVKLTAREYSLVELLALHRGRLITRTQIYEHLFDENEDTLSNLVDVHISNVRKKLGKEFITTRRGQGYLIDD